MSDPIDRELRYSVSHDGWFWRLRVTNPYPMTLPTGEVSIFDQHLIESGYHPRRKGADRAMRRAERRIQRRIDKGHRAMGVN